MNNKNRGIALLFFNQFEDTDDELFGHENDKKRTKKCLELLGFQVSVFKDYTKEQTINSLIENANLDHKDSDCFLCIFSSHGNEQGFITSDYELIDLTSTIPEIFSGDNSLVGKPKLFFIDACRGPKIMQKVSSLLGAGADSRANTPEICDIMIYYSTISKYVSIDTGNGSIFIQTLVQIFNQFGKKKQLTDMVTLINQEIANIRAIELVDPNTKTIYKAKQMSTIVENSLTKRVFF